jgi:serine/threonine protein kinase/tetratricopeptide (TPR) repeat protein
MRELWERAKTILAQALEQNVEDRGTFVRQACGGDQALKAEVESLLAHFDGADSLLENSPAANLLSMHPVAMTGRRLGAYRIVREIGRGGMAAVYLGERDDRNYRKQVAIKMVAAGADAEQVLTRFRNERQTLAALDHPNIVKLLDGGSSEEGSPYLVMEYVEGLPIDRYCDLHQDSIEERLRLFRDVCAAVAYAHAKLVIHRDLKPGNILVDQGGIPRLLDFGIAKLLNPELAETPLVTRTNWLAMTPEYASPEQIRGHAITAATDIYSLGVLLFELLTGHRPYRPAGPSLLEMERAICEQEPDKPSVAGELRGLRPSEFERRLRGDLDTIVMKALRKEPERRYASVAEFSRDIERYLTGMPVKARRATIAYRGSRFLHRHKESLAAALAVLAIAAGIAAWEAHRVARQASAALARNAQAPKRRSVATLGFKNLSGRQDVGWLSTALSEILTTELAAGEELRSLPNDIVARTKMDLHLGDEESISPNALAKVGKILGSDYAILGSYLDSGKAGKRQIRLAVRVQETASGNTAATVSETGDETQLLDLGARTGARLRERLGLSRVSALESQEIGASVASNPEATRLYSQGLARLRSFDALSATKLLTQAVAADPSYPLSHSALASAWLTLSYHSKAQGEARLALDTSGKLSREDHLRIEALFYEATKDWPRAIETYVTLGNLFPDNLEYGLALARAQSAGGEGKQALGTLAALARANPHAQDDPRIDLATAEAATSLEDDRLRRDSAERAAAKAYRQDAKLLVARARESECRALANLGENDKAGAACEEARRVFAEIGDRGGLARALHSEAEVPLNRGDLVSAEKLYREALAITEEVGDKRATASQLVNLGLISVKRGDFPEGRRLYDKSMDSYRKAGDKSGMAMAIGNTGMLLRAQGLLQEALAHFQTTLRMSNELGDRSSAALAFQQIGETMVEQGNLAGAHDMYGQALTIQKEIGEKSYYAATLVDEGKALMEQAALDQARKSYEEALSIQRQLGEKSSTAETGMALAELDLDSGRAADAERLSRSALQEFEAAREPDQEVHAEIVLARSLLAQDRLREAHECISQALLLSKSSPDVFSRLSLALGRASMLAATHNMAAAEGAAHEALNRAGRLGLARLHLEASLTLGGIEMQSGNAGAGRKRLAETESVAHMRGFDRIARKAATAMSANHP